MKARVGARVNTIDDDIRKIIRDIETPAGTTLTTVHIDDTKMKAADAKLKTLGGEWDQFAKEKKLDEQVNAWVQQNNVQQRVHNAQQEVNKGLNDLVKSNGIAQWANEHRVQPRVQEVRNTIRSGIQVTNNAEILDSIKTEWTQDEVMLLAAFGVVVMAAFAAGFQKLRGDKKTDKFEFEVDTEMVPAPKESKKAIKNTLKNIMSKNNAKTTLIN